MNLLDLNLPVTDVAMPGNVTLQPSLVITPTRDCSTCRFERSPFQAAPCDDCLEPLPGGLATQWRPK